MRGVVVIAVRLRFLKKHALLSSLLHMDICTMLLFFVVAWSGIFVRGCCIMLIASLLLNWSVS